MANPVVYLQGNFMATTPSQPTNYNNSGDPDFGMNVQDAQAIGAESEFFRMEWYQNVDSETTFSNGQMWNLQQYTGPADPSEDDLANESNWVQLKTQLIPKPDLRSVGVHKSGWI